MTASIPRLALSDMPPDLSEALRPRVERLGYLGEFFRCAAHQPQALLSFVRFTEDLRAALPDAITEVVALAVASAMRNDYERHQHERLARKLGFPDEWIRAASAPAGAGEHALAPAERAAKALALALLERRGHGVEAELAAVVQASGAAAAVAILLLVGRYATHALMVNALALEPPVPSIFAESA